MKLILFFSYFFLVVVSCDHMKTDNERASEKNQDRVAKLRALCHGEFTVEAQIGDWNDYVKVTCVEKKE